MQNINQLIVTILKLFPKDLGTIEKIHKVDNSRFVLVFEDKPWNWDSRWAIAQGLSLFVRRGTLQLVCQDGDWDNIDTSSLRSEPVKKIREEMALKFLKELRIKPGEYCSVVNPDKPLLLCGVEDKALYEKAGKLWKRMQLEPDQSTGLFRSKSQRKMNKFCELEQHRAFSIVKNLLKRMDTHKVPVAALTCCGNLPVHVCDILEFRNISYAKIIPNEMASDDKENYIRFSQGKYSTIEDLFSKVTSDVKEPTDGDWEKFRVEQMYDIETKFEQGTNIQQLLPSLNTLFSSPHFRRLPLEEKRQVLQKLGTKEKPPFSLLKQLLPEAELEEIFQSDAHYLNLEELLSNQKLDQLPDFEEKISEIVRYVPDADLQKLHNSSITTPRLKEALSRHIEKRKNNFNELMQQLSDVAFENDPEFDQKMVQIAANLTQKQFSELIQSPTVISKVKQELLKRLLIPSLKNSVESQIQKSAKPQMLGLGLIGLVCAVIGVAFDFATTVKWYQLLVTAFFFLETVYCFAIRRHRMAVCCLLFGAGFLGGLFIYGRWGVLIGLIVAFISTLVIRPNKDDEQMNNLRSLQKMLAGKDEKQSRINAR